MSAGSGPTEPSDDPTLVGREVLAAIGPNIVDVTVQLAWVRTSPDLRGLRLEADDKQVVQLRVDHRDNSVAPSVVSLESGAARQLIAALAVAADSADDLVSVRG